MEINKENRPPFVTFEIRAVEDRDATIEAGHYVAKDVNYALIRPVGSKDCVERVADEWFAQLDRDTASGRFPREWLLAFKGVYKDWKEGNETPLSGTPIVTWPGVSPAQAKNLIALRVFTVEDLAAANEEVMGRVGMGCRALKQKAIDWLATAGDSGKVVAELEALRAANADLKLRNDSLSEQLTELSATVKALGSKKL